MLRPNRQAERNLFWLTIIFGVFSVLMISVAMVSCAKAQHAGHPPQDMELHHKFYSTWNMPDNRAVSCCHDEDCFPAQSKFEDGSWYARKTDDEDWVKIPANKIEQERDTPDGRSHLCGRKYTYMGASSGFTVFCFLPGGGS